MRPQPQPWRRCHRESIGLEYDIHEAESSGVHGDRNAEIPDCHIKRFQIIGKFSDLVPSFASVDRGRADPYLRVLWRALRVIEFMAVIEGE